MSKLRDKRGMTLTELLCTIIVMLMVSALMAVVVGFSVRTYRSSMQRSEAQVLASTLTTAISDKLRYCGSVSSTGDKIFIQEVGSVSGSDSGEIFRVSDSGEVVLDEAGEKKLLGSKAYPQGIKVSELTMEYDPDSRIFHIAFTIVGDEEQELAACDFDVKHINYSES